MTPIRISIADQVGGTLTTVEIPDDVPVNQLIPELVTALNLPLRQGENIISYRLDNVSTGNRLADNQTLRDADVKSDEVFSLSPEVTAGCFPAGTKITLPDGTKAPIEELKVGDFVLSYSLSDKTSSQCQITGIYHGTEFEFLVINEMFEVTPSHLIEIDGEWRRADTLNIGEHLKNEDGESVEVHSIKKKMSKQEVYNLNLDAENIFYAGDIRVSDLDDKFARKSINFFAEGYLVNTHFAKLAIAKPLPNIAKSIISTTNAKPLPDSIQIKKEAEGRKSLRDWWHSVLRDYGHYSCYGIFLLLPSDKEAIKYFAEFGDELDLITASDCLIIAFSKSEYCTPINLYDDQIWQSVISQQISEGHSVIVANFFGIDYENFPCLVLFKDIRNPKHIVISLKNSSADEISAKLRKTLSIIHKAAKFKLDPIDAIHQENNKQFFVSQGQSVVSDIRNIVGKTFETGIEAWIKTSLLPK